MQLRKLALSVLLASVAASSFAHAEELTGTLKRLRHALSSWVTRILRAFSYYHNDRQSRLFKDYSNASLTPSRKLDFRTQ